MSSRDRLAIVVLLALPLAGCLQPMYAQRPVATAPGVVAVTSPAASLAAIDIVPIEGRVGQQIRNELIFRFTGGGNPAPPVYRLAIAMKEQNTSAVVDPFTDRPQIETYGIDTAYVLSEAATGVPIFQGNAFGRASYTTTRQRYANLRARRDAEDRAATVVVEQIRARLGSHFAAR